MNVTETIRIILMVLLILCAICCNFTKSLLQSVIIFMSYSSIMCIAWVTMESPDLAITEAAVGAGVSGALFLMALRKIRDVDAGGSDDSALKIKEELSKGKAAGSAATSITADVPSVKAAASSANAATASANAATASAYTATASAYTATASANTAIASANTPVAKADPAAKTPASKHSSSEGGLHHE